MHIFVFHLYLRNENRFPNSVGIHWDNLFPSCTHAVEIDLVSNLVVYNPKNRLRATEVSTKL